MKVLGNLWKKNPAVLLKSYTLVVDQEFSKFKHKLKYAERYLNVPLN